MTNISEHSATGETLRDVVQRLIAMLDTLLREDEPGHIDLGQLGLTQADRELLLEMLGENGTHAEVFDYGHSQISSTAISGVWWVIHLDDLGHVIGEFIEVNYCPEILIAASEDIYEGRETLKARLFEADLERRKRNPGV